ncbi:diguanylate cyclase (GGDEF)-like protein [Lachnotalea glycerini]|nr:EAL domain-containing protein [Lachnotalea glycerini]PXV96141.1 diguanylate cyclase (GGDEF)-like protein [Lachnotalea glycerini]
MLERLKKMLIVDDVSLNRAILSDTFMNEYDVLQAKNGIEAMDIIKRYKDEIIIVLLDLLMPLKSGYEVLKEIKRDHDLNHISVIVSTAHNDVESELNALQLGADDFVNQPIVPEVIKFRVNNIVSKKELELLREKNRILEINRRNEEIYRSIVEQVEIIVFEWTPENGIEYMIEGNMQFVFTDRVFLISNKQMTYNVLEIYKEDELKLVDFINKLKTGNKVNEVIIRLKKESGTFVWCRILTNSFYDDQNQLIRVIGTINNIDEQVKAQNELVYRAEHDDIVDCYNRRTFHTKVEELFLNYPNNKFAIITMNVKKFKVINDVYGTQTGNQVLKKIADIIKQSMGLYDLCSRNHSDIFSICMMYHNDDQILDMIHNIEMQAKRKLFKYKIEFSFGICPVEHLETPINKLSDMATFALFTIKDSILTNVAFYDSKIRKQENEVREMEDEMEDALLNGEFVVYLQPKHNISTGAIIGAESLVRWNHPQKGLILPNKFIPLFENNGFIVKLDEYVWDETCKLMRKWMDKGGREIPVSVNVSRMHIYDSELCSKLLNITKKYNVRNELLELELTESIFIENTSVLFEIMNQIMNQGFRFSLDDFGTGYSSLSILKDVPISEIKLDREFFNEPGSRTDSKIIIKHIIEMSNALGITVVAEGVETKKISEELLEMGCSIAQGFYFSKPMPAKEFEKLLFH